MKKYELLCDAVSAGITASVSITSDSPIVAVGANVSTPVISETLKCIARAIVEKATPRENERINIATDTARDTINEKLSRGERFRKDIIVNREADLCRIDDILEGIIKTITDDCDKMKSQIYGRFLGNVLFHEEWNIVFMHNVSQCIKATSYTDLCILYIFSKRHYENISEITELFNNHSESFVTDIYISIKNLLSLGLLMRVPQYRLTKGDIDHLAISPFGISFAEATLLSLLPESHLEPYETFLSRFL